MTKHQTMQTQPESSPTTDWAKVKYPTEQENLPHETDLDPAQTDQDWVISQAAKRLTSRTPDGVNLT